MLPRRPAHLSAGRPAAGAVRNGAPRPGASCQTSTLLDLQGAAGNRNVERLLKARFLGFGKGKEERDQDETAAEETAPAPGCPAQTVTLGEPQCGAKYGAVATYCYKGANDWWFKEEVVSGSPLTCDASVISQTRKPVQFMTGCVRDMIFNLTGPPASIAPCKDVTEQTVYAGPTKGDVKRCQYKNQQVIEVTLTPGSDPPAGKVITSSAGVSTACDWQADAPGESP